MRIRNARTLVDAQEGLKFAKYPTWIGGKLLFLDVHDACIKSADLSGTVEVLLSLPYLAGGFGVLANDEFFVCDTWRRIIFRWQSACQMPLADLNDVARFCLGDGIIDSHGGLYVGDIGFNYLDPLVDPVATGTIIHISAAGQATIVARDLFFPSGMLVSENASTLIVAETLRHRLTAFDIESDGRLENRRVWAQFGDDIKPDGICLDREEAIWVAGMGECALRVEEGGKIVQKVCSERAVFATALGGPEQRHLFMCTSVSRDPVITRRTPSATIDVIEIEIPGTEC
ncbi:MAG: SMP-30/gluconolactonase/LRE family protein [Proteobacteria bacterium]|nr:SMP-30/gluconolactonase/LRE family protein [Pseudomonadota bacterium]